MIVAWTGLAVSIVVACYNIWRDLIRRTFVEWKLEVDTVPHDATRTDPWRWTVTNIGTEPAYAPWVGRRLITGDWVRAAASPGRVDPGESWTFELRAQDNTPGRYSEDVRIRFGVGRRRKIRTSAGRVQPGETILPRRPPRRRVRLRLEEPPLV